MSFANILRLAALALLLTFLGIGLIVNVIVGYIAGQVAAERKENQERADREL